MSRQYYPYPFAPVTRAPNDPSVRKRKRRTSDAESEADEATSQDHDDDQTQDDYLAEASLPTHIAHQYRIAGQPFRQDPPGAGFPHRAQDWRSEELLTPARLATELANVKPPVLESDQKVQQPSHANVVLKQTHLATLYTLMHRCLLRGDYIRAARALGLLLRTEVSNQQVDLRGLNIWGVGAEILLQGKGQSLRTSEGREEDRNEHLLKSNTVPLTREGFDQAKDYFEALILEFPYRSWWSDRLSALHIYPLMFSQWIAFTRDRDTRARAKLHGDSNMSRTLDDDSDASSEELASDGEELESIRKATLEKAGEIINGMDEVIQSFPYSDDATMWQLKGNLHLWLADLSVPPKWKKERDGDFSDPEDSMSYSSRNSLQNQEWKEHSQQSQQAKDAFSRARDCLKDSFGVLSKLKSEPIDGLRRSVSTLSI
ncbi:hypothetical protein MMC10_002591 [Thelotrema lepadinum]|nr:hypothetical protein [Thelotrema lepadinum]